MALSKAMAAPFLFYNNLLERRPLFTKSITSGVMYAGGDAIAQYTETYNYNKDKEENEKRTTTLDRKRLLVFFVYGTCIGGMSLIHVEFSQSVLITFPLQLNRSSLSLLVQLS